MAANRAPQPPPGLRGNAYPEAINRTLVFFGVTYTPVFANIEMEFPPFLDVFSIGKNWWISFISIATATFYWYGYIKSKKKNRTKNHRTEPHKLVVEPHIGAGTANLQVPAPKVVPSSFWDLTTDWWKPIFPPKWWFSKKSANFRET